jgi:hypothetical protein
MLACAGRVDDDALTDARELLAVAELDRAVDMLAASLVAGRIHVTPSERDALVNLTTAVRSSPALASRLVVTDAPKQQRHRFSVGTLEDPSPEDGVLNAIGRVVEVLPDIRSVSCVWRTTPAGTAAGPVPQRVVIVETGPDGFAPSTAYRVEQALRRAGLRAAVEVVQAGGDMPNYHADALHVARRLPLRTASARSIDRPAAEPAPETASGSLFADPPAATPRTATSTRRRHADKRDDPTTSGRWQPQPAIAGSIEPEHAVAEPTRIDQTPVAPPTPVAAVVTPVETPPQVAEPVVASVSEVTHIGVTPVASSDSDDADLSNRERELLRQLHEELAKREGEGEPEPQASQWMDRTGIDRTAQRHSGYPTAPTERGAWQQRQQRQYRGSDHNTAVNGIPPYGTSG